MGHYSYGPDLVRIDTRSENVVVEEINRAVPEFITVPDNKDTMEQAQYRFDCMHGYDHPLQIEQHYYKLVTVCTDSFEGDHQPQDEGYGYAKFSDDEVAFIKSVQHRPEVAWALDNSFDGLYVLRSEDPSLTGGRFRFAVYLKEEHVTFWKLKYSGK